MIRRMSNAVGRRVGGPPGALVLVPHRVLSKVFVTCTHYVPNECDDALKSRACDAGGDAVLVSENDENSAPYTPHPVSGSERAVRRGRHGVIIAWEK
jgi:hypothetical protein